MSAPVPAPAACPVCAGTSCTPVVDISSVPVYCNVHWTTRAEALRAPTGDLRLLFCTACGHMFNAAFDPALMDYTQSYENSLHFSPRFQTFAEELADRLISLHSLRGKDVVDIGCGKGDFLRLLADRGPNRAVGFDRSYVPGPDDAGDGARIRFVQEFYDERYADTPADLVSCRHVLEHIREPRAFLAGIRRTIGSRPGTAVYFEVPNALYTLRDLGIWDLIYEHCGYYTPSSLQTLFTNGGFNVLGVEETFGKQYLSLDARPGTGPESGHGGIPGELPRLVERFAQRYRDKLDQWRDVLSAAAAKGRRVAAWGGGSKGVTFLNILKDAGPVEAIVDLNPRKQGMFVAGTGQRIITPGELSDLRPDLVIIMNPLYRVEIEAQAAALGLAPEFLEA